MRTRRVHSGDAWFVDGIMRAEIALPGCAGHIMREEYGDGAELRTGWMLAAGDSHWTPLAPKDPEYARCDDLQRTKDAQEAVGWSTIEALCEVEKEFAFCMFHDHTSPANYVRVHEDGRLSF